MKRREFLKATLVTVGAALLAPGCGDDDGGDAQPAIGDQFFPLSVCSGDPRADSVILWTRVEDAALSTQDLPLGLEVARDEAFGDRLALDGGERLALVAEAGFDHCVKVRLTGLEAGSFYWYRFTYEKDGKTWYSRTARTRTAPAADADAAVRFAVCSCQDYNGKYYNTYKRLLREELDFFVHLGDYVYETTGDPGFQETTPDRVTVFRDPEEAIVRNEGTDSQYYAAKSLSNYRDLYRTYRGDRVLQQVHERYPMIAVWDDHEFSDDCFGATATYFDGAVDEHDVERRKNANQVWFEYMPVDFMDAPNFVYDRSATYPDDLRIYRDFEFGRHLHLVMTDLRTYRPDHLVPEDLFPGTVLMAQTELEAAAGTLPDWADPYVDIATHDGGTYLGVLQAAAADAGYDAADVTGNVSVTYINAIVAQVNAAGQSIPLIDTSGGTFEVGLTALSLGKTGAHSAIGTRYLLVADAYELWSAKRYAETAGASESLLGATQEQWFLQTMTGSSRTWKVWGNEYSLVQRVVDLRQFASVSEAFQRRFTMSAEDWDGAPHKRDELVAALSAVGNVVAVTGDIHAFFAGTPLVRSDPTKRIVEFVGSSISSGTYQKMLLSQAAADPVLVAAGAPALALAVEFLLVDKETKPNPPLAYANLHEHGFIVVDLDGSQLQASYFKIPQEHVSTDLPDDQVDDKFTVQRFRVDAGSPELHGEIDGTWKRWDPTSVAWV